MLYGCSMPIISLRRLNEDCLFFERILKERDMDRLLCMAADDSCPFSSYSMQAKNRLALTDSYQSMCVREGCFFVTDQITYHNAQKRPENDYTGL